MANISGSIPLQLTAPALATATTFAAAATKRIQKFSRKIADATNRHCSDVRCTTALPPKAEVHPQSRYVAEVT
jgi:hypothetical protein